jgi:hypothetical protein
MAPAPDQPDYSVQEEDHENSDPDQGQKSPVEILIESNGKGGRGIPKRDILLD